LGSCDKPSRGKKYFAAIKEEWICKGAMKCLTNDEASPNSLPLWPKKAASIESKLNQRLTRSMRWLPTNSAGKDPVKFSSLPGLLKLIVVDKPATQQHEGVNPFTKEPMTFKAKAARKVIRVKSLKVLKDSI
jgi:DNA-binding protein HU-beta